MGKGACLFLSGDAKDDEGEGRDAHDKGIEEVGDDGKGGDAGKGRAHEELGTIGEDALDDAGGGVEEAGGAGARDAVFLRDAAGDVADGDDGDGVIGGAEVGEGCHEGDAGFSAPAPTDAGGEVADDVVEAAVVADEFEHAGGEEGDDDELAHAGHALSHGADPVHEGAGGADEGDGSCGKESEDEDFHDVHAAEGGAEDEEVGEDFEPLGFLGDGDGCEFPAQDDVEQEDEEGCREDDGKVGLEFVLHGAALGAGGGDGGIGDEGEVIAEEGTADDTSGHEGERGACFICQSDGDGHEGDDGADGCADGEGDDAGGEEDAGKYHVGGEKGESEVDSGIDRADVFG